MEQTNDEQAPVSCPSKIVIQSREQSYTFFKDTYKEEYLSHIISSQDYTAIINNCSKIMGNSWSKKRTNDQIKLPRFVIILACISVLLTVIYMVLLYLSSTSDNGTEMLIVSVICVSLGSLIAFGLSIYNFCRKIGKFKSLDEIIQEDLDLYLGSINKKYINVLNFVYIPKDKWIECNILRPVEVEMNNLESEHNKNSDSERIVEDALENEQELITKKHITPIHSRQISHMSSVKGNPIHSKKASIMTDPVPPSKHSRYTSSIY